MSEETDRILDNYIFSLREKAHRLDVVTGILNHSGWKVELPEDLSSRFLVGKKFGDQFVQLDLGLLDYDWLYSKLQEKNNEK